MDNRRNAEECKVPRMREKRQPGQEIAILSRALVKTSREVHGDQTIGGLDKTRGDISVHERLGQTKC